MASIWQRIPHMPQTWQVSGSTSATKSVWKKSAGLGSFFAVVSTPQQQPQQQQTNSGSRAFWGSSTNPSRSGR